MPLIQVQTSATSPEQTAVDSLLKTLSASLSKHIGKSESYIMTAFEAGATMTFAGSSDPACYIAVKSVGSMTPTQTKAMTQDFCQQVSKSLDVAQNRIYIEFVDARGAMWGWNGRTFG